MREFGLIALLAISACAPARGTSGIPSEITASRNANLLSPEEMRAANVDVGTLYDAISRLRPNWLRRETKSFDPGTTGLPAVFVDGQRYGEAESLRSVSANQVSSVRLYRATEAGSRFGLQAGLSGVIEVSLTKK